MRQVLQCLNQRLLAHAEECARKAAAQTDPRLKQDFLDMEKRWLSLAKSFELSERLDDFSGVSRQTANSATPKRIEQ